MYKNAICELEKRAKSFFSLSLAIYYMCLYSNIYSISAYWNRLVENICKNEGEMNSGGSWAEKKFTASKSERNDIENECVCMLTLAIYWIDAHK